MKKSIILSVVILFSIISYGQVKKKSPVKSLPTSSVKENASNNGLANLVGINLDEGLAKLEKILSASNYKAEKIDERSIYVFDEQNKKTNVLDYKNYNISLDSASSIRLRTKDNLIIDLGFSTSNENKIKNHLGIDNFTVIEKTEEKSILRKDNLLAISEKKQGNYDVTIFKDNNYNFTENAIPIDSINLKTPFDVFRNSVLNHLSKKYKILAIVNKNSFVTDTGDLDTEQQIVHLENNLELFFNYEIGKHISVNMVFDNALQLASFKNFLDINSWEKRYTDKSNAEFYRKKNQMIKTESRFLEFFPVPDKKNIEDRLTYSDFDFDKLIYLYNNYTVEDRNKYLEDFYLFGKGIDNKNNIVDTDNHFVLTVAKNLFAVSIANREIYDKNWGLVFHIDKQSNYIKNLFIDSMPETFVYKDELQSGENAGLVKRFFFVKEKYIADKSSFDEQEAIKKQKQAETDAWLQKRQEEKAARAAEVVGTVTTGLINILKKN